MPIFFRSSLRRRALFTLGALAVVSARLLVPAPGVDVDWLTRTLQAPAPLNAASSGLSRISLFALLLTPYLLAWTLAQFALTVAPPARRWAQLSENQTRLAFYVLVASLVIAATQAVEVARAISIAGLASEPGWSFELPFAATLVGGVMLCAHLAARMSARGLGDGFLIILVFPSAAQLLVSAAATFGLVRTGELGLGLASTIFIAPAAGLALLARAAAPSRSRRADMIGAIARIDIWPLILADEASARLYEWIAPLFQDADLSQSSYIAVMISFYGVCVTGGLILFTFLRNIGEPDRDRRIARWTLAAAQSVLAVMFMAYDNLSGAPFGLGALHLTLVLAACGTVLRDIREAWA